jgi:signal transduction histidine kinase
MSHELRTPLNSIIGFTGILLQGLVGTLNPEQQKQLGMVRNSAHHLLDLINDVLDISKIEAGQLQLSQERFDLRASVDKLVQTTRPLAEKKGIGLMLAAPDDTVMVNSDRRRVEQVLLNLISNGIKFTEQGSVNVSYLRKDSEVVIQVRDTGIGIKPEDADGLFRPFSQVDTGLTRKYEGTGLGLSICKRLVELMGGRIWVESQPDTGSTFLFTLPL